MEINQQIIEGNYENCYSSLIQNVKSENDQRLLLDFIEMTKKQCLDMYEKRFAEQKFSVSAKFGNEYVNESVNIMDELKMELLQSKKIIQVFSELNRILSEQLQASLIFGSIIYSFSDFRLKQEKLRQQTLQNQNDSIKQIIAKLKKQTNSYFNMCKTKDDFIFQLKGRIKNLQQQLDSMNSPQKTSSYLDFNTKNNLSQNKTIIPFNNSSQTLELNSEQLKSENAKIDESSSLLKNEIDMYTYSFGKSSNPQNSSEDADNNNIQNLSQIKQEEFLVIQEGPYDPKNYIQQQDQLKQQSKKKQNAQILRNSLDCSTLDKSNKISLFNSYSDSSLKKKQPLSVQRKQIGKNLYGSPIVSNILKNDSYTFPSRNCGGTNFFQKIDPQLIAQMINQPLNFHEEQYNNSLSNLSFNVQSINKSIISQL